MEEKKAQFSFTDFHTINENGQITQLYSTIKFPTEKALLSAMLDYCPINGCTVMMLRHLAESVGWFNPDLTYTHDYDMWTRIALNGVGMHYLNQPLTFYRRHSGMGSVQKIDLVNKEFASIKAYYTPMLKQRMASLPG